MDKMPVLTDADRRECIANLRAFMEADRRVKAMAAQKANTKESVNEHKRNLR